MAERLEFQAKKVGVWLYELPTSKLIALALICTYLAVLPSAIYSMLSNTVEPLGGPAWGRHDALKMVLLGCIAAPLIETAVIQWGCLRLLGRLGCDTRVAICVSALAFGLAHNYSGAYVVFGVAAGLVFALVFDIEDARNGRPFAVTCAVHAIRNGLTLVISLLVR